MPIDYDSLQFTSKDKIDKILGTFDTRTTTFAGSYSGSLTTGTNRITNPVGMKALPTMKWSIDGVNFYPARVKFPIAGAPAATVGIMVDNDYVYFYWSNNTGGAVTFTCIWTLDFIDTDS